MGVKESAARGRVVPLPRCLDVAGTRMPNSADRRVEGGAIVRKLHVRRSGHAITAGVMGVCLLATASGGAWFATAAAATPSPTWNQLAPTTSPPARAYAGMTYDPKVEKLVLFGGRGGGGTDLNDTWLWTGSNWREKAETDSPSPREQVAMAYDNSTNQFVLFGGVDTTTGVKYGKYGDTWLWNGATWVEENPPASPSPRGAAAMAYDPTTRQLVLFGGGIGTAWYNDTWTWNGRTWTQLTPATSPSPRVGASLTYDRNTRQLVLFGGYANDGDEYNDTWTWDGTTWTEQTPTSSPTGRVAPGLAYDPQIGEVLLFGGYYNDYAVVGDTWTWNGTAWTQQTPATSPSARGYADMAWDPATKQLVLFGGWGGPGTFYYGVLDDTSIYSPGGS